MMLGLTLMVGALTVATAAPSAPFGTFMFLLSLVIAILEKTESIVGAKNDKR